jgi:hypothetical protein
LTSDGGLFLGEQALNQQAGITLWFLVVGAGFGLVAGAAVGWFGRRFGWVVIPAVLLLGVVGALATRYLGIHVFGPDPAAESRHASTGTPIQVAMQVDTWVACLGWPIGALVGALLAILAWDRGDQELVVS